MDDTRTLTTWSNAGRWEAIIYDGDIIVYRTGLRYRSRSAAKTDALGWAQRCPQEQAR